MLLEDLLQALDDQCHGTCAPLKGQVPDVGPQPARQPHGRRLRLRFGIVLHSWLEEL